MVLELKSTTYKKSILNIHNTIKELSGKQQQKQVTTLSDKNEKADIFNLYTKIKSGPKQIYLMPYKRMAVNIWSYSRKKWMQNNAAIIKP